MKFYVAFIGKPTWEGGWPYIMFENEKLRDEILARLKDRFKDVEFRGGEIITKYDNAQMERIKREISECEGLLIFTIGHYGDPGIVRAGIELITMGKPTILANCIYCGDHTFVQIYAGVKEKKKRMVAVSSPNFEDVLDAVDILYRVLKLRGKKILLCVIDEPRINLERRAELVEPEAEKLPEKFAKYIEEYGAKAEFYIDLKGIDQAHQWRRDEATYWKHMKEVFGIDVIRVDPEKLCKYYEETDENEARAIAEKWVKSAKHVDPTFQTILNAAKLYLAIKRLLKEYNTDVITIDCGTLLITGNIPAYPCMSFFEFAREGVVFGCESDMDSTLSALLGKYLTDRNGFISNHTFDLKNDNVTYLHCTAPCQLYGADGPPAEYEILYHAESHFIGASPRVIYPIGETLTTIKLSMLKKKIAIRSGKIIACIRDPKACTTKVIVKTNAKRILENYDYQTFGWHRVSFVGDWRDRFIAAAKLLGLEIVEEDK